MAFLTSHKWLLLCGLHLIPRVRVALSSGSARWSDRYFIYDSYSVPIYKFFLCSLSSSVPRFLACFSVLAYLSVLDYLTIGIIYEVSTKDRGFWERHWKICSYSYILRTRWRRHRAICARRKNQAHFKARVFPWNPSKKSRFFFRLWAV